jgi:CRISPR/Cas system CSM-associated protein Csm4 (group 5 of RAMP superfamily)
MQNQTIGIIVIFVAIIIVLSKIIGTRKNKQVCTEQCEVKVAPTFPVTKKEVVAPTPAPETTVKPVKKAVKKVATKKVVKKATKKTK